MTQPELKFIGFIETPYMTIGDCPNNIQSDGPVCQIRLSEEFQDRISGLEVGQHILILYWFENTDRSTFTQQAGEGMIGTFALRSPRRPNPIAAAVLPIEKIGARKITVRGLDCLNGTQLIDIKPAIYQEEKCL